MPNVAVSPVSPAAAAWVGQPFFLVLAIVLLVVVFLGFAPTFYLAPLIDTPNDGVPMPLCLVLHAVLLTAWYVGLVVQSGLIRQGRQALHRTLGMFGVIVAIGVVVSGSIATLDLIPRDTTGRIPTLVTSNTLNLLVFIPLVAVAIHKRSRPQVHKRLMLIASIVIIGPAVGPGRMFGIFLRSLAPEFLSIPVPLYFWLPLVGAMVVHDRLTLGRVHPATIWGGGAKAAAVAITVALASSGGAAAYVDWLRRLELLG